MATRPTAGVTLPTLAHRGGHLSGFLHVQAMTAWGDPLASAEAVLEVTLSAAGWAATIAGAELHGTHGDAFAAVLGAVLGGAPDPAVDSPPAHLRFTAGLTQV